MDLTSGYPFWLIKDGLPFHYPKLNSNLETDVVILGGGISGSLAAYHLTEANIKCIVLDSRSIGLGSTCASTSLLQYEIDEPLIELTKKIGEDNARRAYSLCSQSIDKLEIIAKKIGLKDFEPKKSLYYAAKKGDVNFLKKEYEARKKAGFPVNYLASDEINSGFNFKASGAILSDKGATTNAYQLTHFLHQYAIKKGLKVFDRTGASTVKHINNGLEIKTENGFIIQAKKIIYATGYEVSEMLNKKIVNLNTTFACVSEQFNDKSAFWKDEVLIWNTANPYLYTRTTNDNRLLVGGRDTKYNNPNLRSSQLESKTKKLISDFNKIFPSIPFKPEFCWAGTFGSTKDGLPYIGTNKKYPNSYFALGFGGNGITFSLIAAEIITDLIKGNSNSDAELFSFER